MRKKKVALDFLRDLSADDFTFPNWVTDGQKNEVVKKFVEKADTIFGRFSVSGEKKNYTVTKHENTFFESYSVQRLFDDEEKWIRKVRKTVTLDVPAHPYSEDETNIAYVYTYAEFYNWEFVESLTSGVSFVNVHPQFEVDFDKLTTTRRQVDGVEAMLLSEIRNPENLGSQRLSSAKSMLYYLQDKSGCYRNYLATRFDLSTASVEASELTFEKLYNKWTEIDFSGCNFSEDKIAVEELWMFLGEELSKYQGQQKQLDLKNA